MGGIYSSNKMMYSQPFIAHCHTVIVKTASHQSEMDVTEYHNIYRFLPRLMKQVWG